MEGLNDNDEKSSEEPKLVPPVERPEDLTEDQWERYLDNRKRHPEFVIPPEKLREAGPEIAEFEAEVALFESEHSLAELHEIIELTPELALAFEYAKETPERVAADIKLFTPEYAEIYKAKIARIRATVLSPEEAKKYKIRMAAQKALIPIVAKLNELEKDTNISKNKFNELLARYRLLSRAIGNVRNGTVEHDH